MTISYQEDLDKRREATVALIRKECPALSVVDPIRVHKWYIDGHNPRSYHCGTCGLYVLQGDLDDAYKRPSRFPGAVGA